MDKEPTEEDLVFVTESLGRKPEGLFTVVVRDELDNPRVIRNDPLLANGRPMPTLYWLVDPLIRSKIGTLESRGGVKQAEKECDSKSVKEAHERYSKERDLRLPDSYTGPKPSGGVGGRLGFGLGFGLRLDVEAGDRWGRGRKAAPSR